MPSRENHSDGESLIIHDTHSIIIKRHLEHLTTIYQILNDLFKVLAPRSNVCANWVAPEDTIIVYKEQMRQG